MPTVAIFNQKGGVAKTTSAVNLAALWAGQGKKTLLVDMDAQGNATAAFGIAPRPARGVYDLMIGAAFLDELLQDSRIDNLKILPSTPNLSGLDLSLADLDRPQLVLRQALAGVEDVAEYVVIDCPPTLGLPSVNALAAAHEVVIPSFCYRHAQDGLHATWANVQRLSCKLNPGLRINGVLLINPEANEVSKRMADVIRAEFGDRVYPTAIPGDVKIHIAEESDMPLTLMAPDSAAARAYVLLQDEIDRRIVNASRRSGGAVWSEAEQDDAPPHAASWLGALDRG